MGNHIWGYWDCPYCDSKGIRGDNQNCPHCGAPVLPGTQFYVKEGVREEVEQSEVNDDANWICEYCDAQNLSFYDHCHNCGSPREEAQRDYFSALTPEPEYEPDPAYLAKRRKQKIIKKLRFYGVIALLLAFLAWFLTPITRTANIESFEWERNINIEEYKNVEEDDWSLPNNANLHYTKEEVHHYNQVLDHYEKKTKKVAKQVQDGYDIERRDLGNGQFEEERVPRYRTEYETKTYEEPVYRSEPVYRTKYYYDIDKWTKVSDSPSSGKDQSPYWNETGLPTQVNPPKIGDKREGDRSEKYYAVFKDAKGNTQKLEYSLSEWSKLSIGDGITYKTFRYSNKPID
ncbi:hypothetical protein [uncultured Ruminococcus sp.]|uniref:hypothetical protein n=1 Tax=uncultured Ruminococcus sp. TaxID=165186 RepID=UPI0026005DE1|nr:hypothetical protein [uncultured Ruminococcus sp.]